MAYATALEGELLPTLTDELHHLNAADRLDQSVVATINYARSLPRAPVTYTVIINERSRVLNQN